MKIAIASDHAGYALKTVLRDYLKSKGYEVYDFGASSCESVDYPDYAHPLAAAMSENRFDFGVLVCHSGNGVNMVANRYHGVRSAICWNLETARLARAHNNACICSLPAHFIDEKQAKEILNLFLSTDFEGGRHQRRTDKIDRR
ncbi:MAG: ribose 5-phosphate isomerase B [Prevotellaceae bacterium]|jgi:ribose 5-phosphate isomerase B|nr:ribose 5-phosphate isomerase B [Prevotellaceae bacterium]